MQRSTNRLIVLHVQAEQTQNKTESGAAACLDNSPVPLSFFFGDGMKTLTPEEEFTLLQEIVDVIDDQLTTDHLKMLRTVLLDANKYRRIRARTDLD